MKLPAGSQALWDQLATEPRPAPLARFDPDSLDTLPAPAVRWLSRALPAGVALVDTAELTMSGHIKIGNRWMPFTARQILRASVGFVWRPTVGGRLLRFVGADILGPDDARMEFRLHGFIPVARASGPDTARSAAGRLAAETIAWLPQAVTPQTGAVWRSVDDDTAVVTVDAAGETIDVHVTVDPEGRLASLQLQRWNDAADPPAAQPFGGPVTTEHIAENRVRVAGTGRVGWGYGTPAAEDGQFFSYAITGLDWIASD